MKIISHKHLQMILHVGWLGNATPNKNGDHRTTKRLANNHKRYFVETRAKTVISSLVPRNIPKKKQLQFAFRCVMHQCTRLIRYCIDAMPCCYGSVVNEPEY